MKGFLATVALFLFVQQGYGQTQNIIELAETLGASSLKGYLDTAGLTATLAGTAGSPFTVFAPTNAAFEALPQDIKDRLTSDSTFLTNVLLYHVIGATKAMSSGLSNDLVVPSLYTGNSIRINIYGSKVYATGSEVTTPDQEATNGVIHVISSVMIPPEYDVVGYASNNAAFSTLTELVVAAGLATTLAGGNLTVFAPTNDAFAKLSQEVLDDLKADTAKLTKVLTFHVAGSTVYSYGLSNNMEITTLNDGEKVKVTIVGSTVRVDGAQVIIPNVGVKNGVIHAIDTVLMPEDDTDAAFGMRPSLLLALACTLMALFYRL